MAFRKNKKQSQSEQSDESHVAELQVSQLQEQIKQLQHENKDLLNQQAIWKKNTIEFNQCKKTLQLKINSLKNKKSNLSTQLQDLQVNYSQVTEQSKKLEIDLQQAQASLKAQQDVNTSLQNQLNYLKPEIQQIIQQKETLGSKVQILEKENMELQGKKKQYQDQAASMVTLNKQLKNQNIKLNEQFQELQKNFQEYKKNHRHLSVNQQEAKQEDQKDLFDKLQQLEVRSSAQQTKIIELMTDLQQKSQKQDQTEEQLTDLQDQYENLKDQINKQEKQNFELKDQNTQLESVINEFNYTEQDEMQESKNTKDNQFNQNDFPLIEKHSNSLLTEDLTLEIEKLQQDLIFSKQIENLNQEIQRNPQKQIEENKLPPKKQQREVRMLDSLTQKNKRAFSTLEQENEQKIKIQQSQKQNPFSQEVNSSYIMSKLEKSDQTNKEYKQALWEMQNLLNEQNEKIASNNATILNLEYKIQNLSELNQKYELTVKDHKSLTHQLENELQDHRKSIEQKEQSSNKANEQKINQLMQQIDEQIFEIDHKNKKIEQLYKEREDLNQQIFELKNRLLNYEDDRKENKNVHSVSKEMTYIQNSKQRTKSQGYSFQPEFTKYQAQDIQQKEISVNRALSPAQKLDFNIKMQIQIDDLTLQNEKLKMQIDTLQNN